MNHLTSLFCIAIATAGASTAWAASTTNKGANPNGKPFIEFQGQIIEVEGEVSTLEDQVDALVGQVESLEGRVTANEDTILSLQATNVSLQAQIDANADGILSIMGQITDLEAEDAALQGQIDELGDADGYLQGMIDANSVLITSLQMQLEGLTGPEGQIANNSLLIQELQDQIADINTFLDQKQALVNGTCPSGQAIQEILPDGEVVCVVAGGGPGTLQTVTSSRTGYAAHCPSAYRVTGCNSRMYISHSTVGTLVSGNGCRAFGRSSYSNITQAICARLMP